MKVRLSRPLHNIDGVLSYFCHGPEAAGYGIKKFEAAPRISEYRRSEDVNVGVQRFESGMDPESTGFEHKCRRLLEGQLPEGGTVERRLSRSIAGWDIVIDVPKHVTLLGLVVPDVEVLTRVDELRRKLLCCLIQELRTHPIGHDGRVLKELCPVKSNFLIEFPHFMSRPVLKENKSDNTKELTTPDPQLHWHHILPNLTPLEEDEAILRPLWIRRMAKMMGVYGALFRNKLIEHLRDMGFPAIPDPRHQILIEGMDTNVLPHFSNRGVLIEEEARLLPFVVPEEKAKLAKLHRAPKDNTVNVEGLLKEWRERILWGQTEPLRVRGTPEPLPLKPFLEIFEEPFKEKLIIKYTELMFNVLQDNCRLTNLEKVDDGLKTSGNFLVLNQGVEDLGFVTSKWFYSLAQQMVAYSQKSPYSKATIEVEPSDHVPSDLNRWLSSENSMVLGIETPEILKLKSFHFSNLVNGWKGVTAVQRDSDRGAAVFILDGSQPDLGLLEVSGFIEDRLALGSQFIIQQDRSEATGEPRGLLDLMSLMGFSRTYRIPRSSPYHSKNHWLRVSDTLEEDGFSDFPDDFLPGYVSLEESVRSGFSKAKAGSIFLWTPGQGDICSELEPIIRDAPFGSSKEVDWRLLLRQVSSAGKHIVYPASTRKGQLWLKNRNESVGPIALVNPKVAKTIHTTKDGVIHVPSNLLVSGFASAELELPKFRSFPSRLIVGLSGTFSLVRALDEISEGIASSENKKSEPEIIFACALTNEDPHEMIKQWRRQPRGIDTRRDARQSAMALKMKEYFDPWMLNYRYEWERLERIRRERLRKRVEAEQKELETQKTFRDLLYKASATRAMQQLARDRAEEQKPKKSLPRKPDKVDFPTRVREDRSPELEL